MPDHAAAPAAADDAADRETLVRLQRLATPPPPRPAFVQSLRDTLMTIAPHPEPASIPARPVPPPAPPRRVRWWGTPRWGAAATLLFVVLVAVAATMFQSLRSGPTAPTPLIAVDYPAPPGCEVTPRPLTDFALPSEERWASLEFDRYTKTSFSYMVMEMSELPAGIPVTPVETTAIVDFLTRYTTCQNAGDIRRQAALQTDELFFSDIIERLQPPPADWVDVVLSQIPFLWPDYDAIFLADLAKNASAPPVPIQRPIKRSVVREVRHLPDGRWGALITQVRDTNFWMFREVDGELRLDGIISLHMVPEAE